METLEQHLKNRGVDFRIHHPIIDEETRTATFMLFSQTGKLLGFQTYKPEGPKTSEGKGFDRRELRYFTHAVAGEMPIFGTFSLEYQPHLVFLVEGIFDAVKFHSLGIPCLAVLGNDPVRLRPYLRALNRRVIGFCDRDKAGLNLADSCDIFYVAPGKDAGEMTHKQLLLHLLEGKQFYRKDGESLELPHSSYQRYTFRP